jgi:uncharacterized glyoxalase superfamily protein PhnB
MRAPTGAERRVTYRDEGARAARLTAHVVFVQYMAPDSCYASRARTAAVASRPSPDFLPEPLTDVSTDPRPHAPMASPTPSPDASVSTAPAPDAADTHLTRHLPKSITKLTPNLMVDDVQRTLAFYVDRLGFEFVMAVPASQDGVLMERPADHPLAYAVVRHGTAELMFQERESLGADVPAVAREGGVMLGGSFTLYFEVDDADRWHDRVQGYAEVIQTPRTTWYGMRECYVRDVNGYVLGFAHSTLP